jgi:hypothetical protein
MIWVGANHGPADGKFVLRMSAAAASFEVARRQELVNFAFRPSYVEKLRAQNNVLTRPREFSTTSEQRSLGGIGRIEECGRDLEPWRLNLFARHLGLNGQGMHTGREFSLQEMIDSTVPFDSALALKCVRNYFNMKMCSA